MKNIYIGDIHGRKSWKNIVEDHPDVDNIIFIGDYFDSFNVEPVVQLHNAKEIVEFKKWRELDPTKKVYLLTGNHDHHYWPGVKFTGNTSGFQATMWYQFNEFFIQEEKMFQMAVLIGKNLCTHAGVSSTFIEDEGYWEKNKNENNIADFLNDLFHHKPNHFGFDSYFDKGYGYADGYGNDIWQTPIWIRPKALQHSNKKTTLLKNYIQIIGHTPQPSLDIKGKANNTGGKYYYIDCLSKKEYLIEIDNVFSVGVINN